MKAIARRQFLVLTASTVGAVIAGCSPVPLPKAAPALAPTSLPPPNPPPAAPEVVAGLHLTPVGDFYVTSYSDTPAKADLNTYRFGLDGLVEHPLSLSYADLTGLPAVEMMRTMECIGNPVGGELIGNQIWKGTRLSGLLQQAGVKPAAKRVRFYALDQYSNSLDIERILQPDTLLVYEMAGKPLPPDHGYPLRILIPGHYGQKQPKWLQRMEMIDNAYQGYWEHNGWSDTAIIKINSRIDSLPSQAATGQAVRITGVAMSREIGVKTVEVGVKAANAPDITWHEAQLTRPPTPLAWTEWSYAWTPTQAGEWTVYARATDNGGTVQAGEDGGLFGDAFPDGSSAIHHENVAVA